ncbi:hypothetical protein A5681_04520 [Mycobacterium scrofulaceum]|uniref:hypothetical protein n=1 Tax=Mycobacterium scrofulaceum TaxID=1783 RepID=UPI0007FEAEFF|nr:hypothetical protein [Mycobacterium scrofulaceum]OBH80195.1 hypothetical protein A5681_04520 [Mycobacterium scrofulaceum]
MTAEELGREKAERQAYWPGDESGWADALFARVERDRPDLIEPVFRALSKVLYSHPGESPALQAELNAARERFMSSRNVS